MDLKEQFKNYLQILIKNGNTDYDRFKIYSDFYCSEKLMCKKKDYCNKCRRKCKTQADVILIDWIIQKVYNFNQPNGINTYEEMFLELDKANEFIMEDRNKKYKLNQKKEELFKYADYFFKKVIDDFELLLNKEILPIRLNNSGNEDRFKDENTYIGGYLVINKLQNAININGIRELEDIKDIEFYKTNIRHEILHYILYVLFLNYNDSSGVFHFLCNIYDAEAYEPMDEKEKDIFDKLMFIYNNMDDYNKFYNFMSKKRNKKGELLRTLIILAGTLDKWTPDELIIPDFTLDKVYDKFAKIIMDKLNENK